MRALVALHNPPQNDPSPRSPSATAKPIRCRSPSRSLTARRITTIARSRSDRRRSASARRRMHGRPSCRTRCASSPGHISSTGSRTRRAITSPAWCSLTASRISTSRSISSPTWRRSTRSTSSWSRTPSAGRSAYDPVLEQELAPFRRLMPVGPRLQELLDQVPRGEQRDRGHAGRAQPPGAEPRQLHRPHGARRVDARRDPGGG